MYRLNLTPFIFACFFLLYPISGFSSVYENLTIEEVVSDSELVFEGKVIALIYKVPTDRNTIYTFVTFEINDVIKGDFLEKTIAIRYPGGKNGDQIEVVSDMIIPQVGEEGIYFVKSLTKHYIHPLTGWAQGQMVIVKDEAGKKRVFSVSGKSIYSINSIVSKKSGRDELSADVAMGVLTGYQNDQAISLDKAKNQLKAIVNLELRK